MKKSVKPLPIGGCLKTLRWVSGWNPKLLCSACGHQGSLNILTTVKPVLRGQLWDKEKVALYDR